VNFKEIQELPNIFSRLARSLRRSLITSEGTVGKKQWRCLLPWTLQTKKMVLVTTSNGRKYQENILCKRLMREHLILILSGC
jgi:hypothetical protein